MRLPSIRRTKLYNAIIKFRRQNKSKTSGIAQNKRTKTTQKINFRRGYIYLAVAVVILIVVIPILKLGWDYGHLQLTIVTDNYSIEKRDFEIENQAFYLLESELGSDKRFLKGIYVFSFDHKSKELSIISVSPDFVVYVPYLNKTLGLRTTYNNAVAVNKEPLIAINSATKTLLGISMQGYSVVDSRDLGDLARLVQFSVGQAESAIGKQIDSINIFNWINLYANIVQISSKVATTNSSNHLISILNNLDGYKLKNTIQIGNNYGAETNYSFGVGYAPDLNMINQALIEPLRITPVLAEQIKVEVFNASGQGGLAGRISRLLSNYGVNVVRFSNAPRGESKTKLYTREGVVAPLNIDLIKNLIRIDFQVSQENYEYNSTGDLVLVLGEDSI
jgi:hypothetical protein